MGSDVVIEVGVGTVNGGPAPRLGEDGLIEILMPEGLTLRYEGKAVVDTGVLLLLPRTHVGLIVPNAELAAVRGLVPDGAAFAGGATRRVLVTLRNVQTASVRIDRGEVLARVLVVRRAEIRLDPLLAPAKLMAVTG